MPRNSGLSNLAASHSGKYGTYTISTKTTFVTRPLDSSGHIDFVAALNERLSRGVTPENNANVAIWKVLGPKPQGTENVPVGFFVKMGMQSPPVAGDYFIHLKQYVKQHGGNDTAASTAMGKYSQQIWTANQDAVLSGWLKANHNQSRDSRSDQEDAILLSDHPQ